MKSKSRWINVSLLIASVVCGLLIAEAVARVFIEPPRGHALSNVEQTEAHSSLMKTISDAKLLHRLAPNSPGHDVRGFRNAAIREAAADVVAIGDSQTWGINVRQDETWPSVLGRVGKVSVYSMSLGGWGPIQYEVLAADALLLKPRAVLVGIYFGNDIFDSCNHAYGTDAYPQYRHVDAGHAAALSDLHARLKVADDLTRVDRALQQLTEMGGVAKLWQRLARHSLIVQILMTQGLLPAIPSVDELYEMADTAWAREHPEVASVYSWSNGSTVMTYGYRGVAVDLANACIRDGVRITREVLDALKRLGDRTTTQIGIVFIPTKESVYAMADRSLWAHMPKGFEDLVHNETAIKEELLDHCMRTQMVCIDAAVWLVKAAQKGMVLYKADSDGHPIAEGYRQIAYAGQQALEAMRALSPR